MVGRKPEDWRWLTPIFSMLSPIIVAALSWFLVNLYNVQQTFNNQLLMKLDKYVERQDIINLSFTEKIARCCSERKMQEN